MSDRQPDGASPAERPRHEDPGRRLAELEALLTDVLAAGATSGLPPALLSRLLAAVGHRPIPLAEVSPMVSAAATRATVASSAATGDPAREPLAAAVELQRWPVRKAVLVVDDDPMMLTVLGHILERENFELMLAASGPEALAALHARDGAIDLLVTDFAMPGMEGRELARRVRERHPEVRVLYQTGFSDLLFDQCVELEPGAAFLEKPFTARGLREAARMVLFGGLNPP